MNSLLSTLYSRSQTEWTIWNAFFLLMHKDVPSDIPLTFKNRIKRLLEIDANLTIEDTPFAFKSDNSEGLGDHRRFSLLDISLLALALRFLDNGFNQQEVVILVKCMREGITEEILAILKKHEQWIFPCVPTWSESKKKLDKRSFLVIQQTLLDEIYNKKENVVLKNLYDSPLVFHGINKLSHYIDNCTAFNPHLSIFEFGELAMQLSELVKIAPEAKRGRKPSKTKGNRND